METATLQEEKEQLRKLIIKEAYFKEKITLSSGKTSDYYIDVRLVTLKPLGAYLCARQILHLIGHESADAIGGPTLGADPMVGAIGVLSLQNHKPINTFIIRKSPKAHGKKQQLEGPALKKGSRVVLIDDVATTGKALLESVEVLRSIGIEVKKAVCLVDREEGAKEALAKVGCELISIFTAGEIHSA